MNLTVVVGNPKPASRTAEAATLLAHGLAPEAQPEIVDVITLGPGLLGWGDPAVTEAVAKAAASDLLIVASPTFKATYAGLLKLFLDQFETGTGLQDVVAVPLMLGAGPAHFMASDLLLKPVLAELGAACPAPGLYLMDKTYDESPAMDEWITRWGSTIRGTMTALQGAAA
ncbi:MAG: NAD(P)H-dependent oxidoreductase [Nocardioides sp.]|uniref:NADPH-dependent FMN reductase n=1 Tax=Nocardioides sp. TaxID=35761 RepID=UPI0039E32A1E